jgi:hypothetical protein
MRGGEENLSSCSCSCCWRCNWRHHGELDLYLLFTADLLLSMTVIIIVVVSSSMKIRNWDS